MELKQKYRNNDNIAPKIMTKCCLLPVKEKRNICNTPCTGVFVVAVTVISGRLLRKYIFLLSEVQGCESALIFFRIWT